MALLETGEALSASARAVAATEARTARAFAAARRHSRLVRFLRFALPIGAVGSVATLTALTLVRTFSLPIAGLTISSASVSGTKVTMENPKLTGGRPDGSSYVLNARTAVQDLKNPNAIELSGITGDIGSHDQPPTKLSATAGHYEAQEEKLKLYGVVQLKNASYTVDLKSADVDFKANAYSTEDPISVVTSSGMTIVADKAQAAENASKLSFFGHVKTTMPARDDHDPAPAMKSETP